MSIIRAHNAARIIEHIVLVIALLWAAGCTLIWSQTAMPRRILKANSSDGSTQVIVDEIGSPMFFGPSKVSIKALWDTDPNVIGAESFTGATVTLYNDGKTLQRNNFTITWQGDVPTIITHGEEQPDLSYTFDSKDASH